MKVLVVDREWIVRDTLRKKLQKEGNRVYTVDTAEEALNLTIIADIDLLITAADLPEITGFDLIERITRGRKDLDISAIVLLDREAGFDRGTPKGRAKTRLLMKPVTGEALEKCLADIDPQDRSGRAGGGW